MAKKKIICDTDVMIDYWDKAKPRHAATKSTIEMSIELDNVVLSAITKMELMIGAANKTNMIKITKKLSRFNIALINNDITLRALDYLETREDADMKRVATMGMSMGSTMSWWLAALDDRIKVCVDLCCLTDFQTLLEEKALGLHGIYYYVPDLLNHFSTSQINALISPRPHFGLAGRLDPLTPLKGLEIIDKNLKEVYQKDGAPEAWQLKIYNVGHLETPEMRQDIMTFLKKWL